MSLFPPAPRSRPSILKRVVVTTLFALAILGGSLGGVFLAYENDLPQVSKLEDFQPNIITQVYAADGSILGEFSIEKRVLVSFKDIALVLRNAIVAVEDGDFWSHVGINFWRVPGAVFANLRSGRKREGFSTLTMQLSRLLFLTPEKTYERKVKEIILAFQIEKNFTKEEIFTLYCNQIYFGHGTYGVEAASRFYFGKSAKDVTLAEAALLAGIPQNPVRLSPIEYAESAKERRDHVLQRMVDERYISAAEARKAMADPIELRLRKDAPSRAPYFLEEVRKYLEREYGSQRIYQGGLRVYTTLDPRLQAAATKAVRSGLLQLDRKARGWVAPSQTVLDAQGTFPQTVHLDEWDWPFATGDVVRAVVLESDRTGATLQIGEYRARLAPVDVAWTRHAVNDALPRGAVVPVALQSVGEQNGRKEAKVTLEQEPKLEGALLAMDVRSGAVRAMVGGYDYQQSKFNRSTQAMRQVGSAFKPIVYSAAIERANMTLATVILDAPISFPNPGNKSVWAPHNYDFNFLGPIPLRRALELSRNIPAIKTLQAVGVETGIEYARKLGLKGELPPYLPIAIGAGEATLQEMVGAFATFANQGLRMQPMLITRIADRDGNTLEEPRPQAHDAVRADTAYLMTSLLRGVVERGTATRAKVLKRPVGGKTGTTDDWTDAWFIGFEPSLAAGVWLGFDDKRVSLGRGQDGAHTALPIWIDFWQQAMKDKPIEDFPIPGNIVFVPVNEGGAPDRPGTEGVRMEAFIAGTEPKWATPATTVASAPAQ